MSGLLYLCYHSNFYPDPCLSMPACQTHYGLFFAEDNDCLRHIARVHLHQRSRNAVLIRHSLQGTFSCPRLQSWFMYGQQKEVCSCTALWIHWHCHHPTACILRSPLALVPLHLSNVIRSCIACTRIQCHSWFGHMAWAHKLHFPSRFWFSWYLNVSVMQFADDDGS